MAPALLQQVAELDRKARQVQLRLAHSLEQMPAPPSDLRGPKASPEGEEAALAPPSPPPAQVPEQGGHAFCHEGLLSWCSRCRQGTQQGPGAARLGLGLWAEEPCKGPTSLGETFSRVHSSHQMVAIRSVLFCLRCGRWAKLRVRGLSAPCGPPQPAGLGALRALFQGKEPQGLGGWPA